MPIDLEWVLTDQPVCCPFMDIRFCRTGPIECLPEASNAFVGMNQHP
ncbi:mandelate racemase/muconate lactonizing domain protein [Burkholderia pseudomallei ABCPW 107]|nr:mandelate racemase/muconate lactonizing domain protein [Burkholderia pseudomallei ABCPW 107]